MLWGFGVLIKDGAGLKVISKPVNTRKRGIQVPCMYIVNGKEPFVQDIRDNITCC